MVRKLSEVVTALEQLTEERNCNHKIRCILNSRLGTVVFVSFVYGPLKICSPISQEKGLDLQQSSVKLVALRGSLLQNREKMVDIAMDDLKKLCSEMGISMERRTRKKKRMDCERLTDAALGFDAELRREILRVIDRLTEEISGRFQQVHAQQTNMSFLYRQICLMIITIVSLAKLMKI